MDLQLTNRRIGDVVVVALGGVADLSTAPELYDGLVRAITEHAGEHLLVELDGLILLDDVAIGLLIGAAARAREAGGELALICTNERIRDRLAATRVDRIIAMRDSIVQ